MKPHYAQLPIAVPQKRSICSKGRIALIFIAVGLVATLIILVFFVTRRHSIDEYPYENNVTNTTLNGSTTHNCTLISCQNGGKCIVKNDTLSCDCAEGYSGLYCDVKEHTPENVELIILNHCDSQPCKNGARCSSELNTFTCQCLAGYGGTYCQETYKISFFAQAMKSSLIRSSLVFQHSLMNDGGGLITNIQSSFVCPQNGIYWVFFAVVWTGTTQANVTMLGTNLTSPPQILRLHTVFKFYDIISLASVQHLTAGQELTLFTDHVTYADKSMGSSWGGFRLDQLMMPLVVFETTSLSSSSFEAGVDIRFSFGYDWINDNKFVAERNGTYYFSASIKVRHYVKLMAYFEVNNKQFCTLQLFEDTHRGLDLASRGCLLSLKRDDIVQLTMFNYIDNHAALSYSEASFKGFFYSPVHLQHVAWSLHVNKAVGDYTGIMPFEQLLVATSNVWNTTSEAVIIPLSGTYFVEIVSTTDEDGTINMFLILNNAVTLMRLLFSSKVSYVTRSQQAVLHLKSGDRLEVTYMYCKMTGDNHQGISFQGFLLYPD